MLTIAAATGGAAALIANLFPVFAVILIFYFMVIRPGNQQRKRLREMLDALKKGDRVITNGGIHGVIQSVDDDTVQLKIADNVKIKLSRSAIASMTDAKAS